MGELADRLDALTVTVSSPDGGIEAELVGSAPRSLRFRPGAYHRYREPELAHQLARTGTLLFVGRDRRVQQIMEEAGLRRIRRPMEASDEAQLRYLTALREVHAGGLGPRQLVRFETVGLAEWRCDIADGTIGYLPEAEFVAEAMGAALSLLQQHRYETALLRNEHFGSDWSEATRQRVRQRSRST